MSDLLLIDIVHTGIGGDRREVGLPCAVAVEIGLAQRRDVAIGAVQRFRVFPFSRQPTRLRRQCF